MIFVKKQQQYTRSLCIDHPRGHLKRISNLFMICNSQPPKFPCYSRIPRDSICYGNTAEPNELKEECIRFKHGMIQYPRSLCPIVSTWDSGTMQPSQPHSSVTFLLNMTVVATLSLTDAMSNTSAFIIQLIFKPLVH